MSKRRVVITGMGCVSCVGNDVASMWESVVNGKCGLDKVTLFDATEFKTQIAGEVKNLRGEDFIPAKELKRVDDYCLYAIAAFVEAMRSAGLPEDFRSEGCPIDRDRVGVIVGSGIGGMRTIESQARVLIERGPSRISPFFIPMLISDMAAGMISIRCGARGPNFSAVSACASAAHAIGEAYSTIVRGDADAMITGGAEATISALGFSGFCSMKAMSQRNDDPLHASRPFDRERDGFVMSEGSGILFLEELEHAKARGAHIIAEMIGYGASGDGYHITSPAPGGEGGVLAFKQALKSAEIDPTEVDYVNAHGTSTHLNDLYETQALKTVFGRFDQEFPLRNQLD